MRVPLRRGPILLVSVALALPGTLAAQSPADRAAIDALRDSLGPMVDQAVVRARHDAASAAAPVGPMAKLRLGTVAMRLGQLAGRRDPLDEAARAFADAAEREPGWPEAWYGLGLVKLALHDAGHAVKEGPHQPLGMDYLHGAANAFIRALEADPGFALAADHLAPTVLRQVIQPQVKEALAPLRRSAWGSGAGDPRVHLARGLMERESRQGDSALVAFQRYLDLGGDPGVARLELARTLYDLGRPGEAERGYYAGAAGIGSRAARAMYRADLAWIATPAELAAFDSLAPEAAPAWLGAFWGRRDAREGRASGERLAEHYRRWFYAMRNFRLVAGGRSVAGDIVGTSAFVRDQTPPPDVRLRQLVEANTGPDGSQTIAESGQIPSSGPDITDMTLADVYLALSDQTLLRAYRSDQRLVDDRGVIYLRHGEPAQRARYSRQDVDPNESWKYLTPAGPLIFHFMGTTAPTTLVNRLPPRPDLLETRGELDPRYNRMAAELRPRAGVGRAAGASAVTIAPESVQRDEALGREAIAAGTTTDSYTLSFDRAMAPVVQVFGVARGGGGGGGRLLVVFAAPAGGLALERMGPDSTIVYPVTLRVAAEEAGGAVVRTDTTRLFATRRVLAPAEWVTGLVELPAPPGRYGVTVVLADAAWQSGSATRIDDVVVPDRAASTTTMSDVVIGREGSGLRWLAPPDTVLLNPLNAYAEGASVEVYAQLGGLRPGQTYRVRIEVGRRDQPGGRDRVTVGFDLEPTLARAALTRAVGLGSLKPGTYVLTLTVEAPDGARLERRQLLNVVKR